MIYKFSDIRQIVNRNGIRDAMALIPSNSIKDPFLRDKWLDYQHVSDNGASDRMRTERARYILNDIENYLNSY